MSPAYWDIFFFTLWVFLLLYGRILNKTAYIFYTGLSYATNYKNPNTDNRYDLNMEHAFANHMSHLHAPLEKMGYKVSCSIITNKNDNPNYKRTTRLYNAKELPYEDVPYKETVQAAEQWFDFRYQRFLAMGWGYGMQGARLLTIPEIPKADIYLFVRCDLKLKKPLDELNIKYDKINYMWKEEEAHRQNWCGYYKTKIDKSSHPRSAWNLHRRVGGNMLNVVAFKYIKAFVEFYWMEHCALLAMLRASDYITLDDVHFMCGDEMYDSGVFKGENPIFSHFRI